MLFKLGSRQSTYHWLDNTNNICNNSVDYSSSPVVYTCDSADLCFNHGAYDIDGDSLIYSVSTNAETPTFLDAILGSHSSGS